MLGTLMINVICITSIKILKAQNAVNYLIFSHSESSYTSNYTEYITNKERVSWPISASYFFLKLFWTILSVITSCTVPNWENQAASVLCVRVVNDGFGEGLQRRSRGISSKTSDLPLPTPNNIENWAKCRWKRGLYGCNIAGAGEEDGRMNQCKPNEKLSLRAEYIPCNLDASVFSTLFHVLRTLYWSTNCFLVR